MQANNFLGRWFVLVAVALAAAVLFGIGELWYQFQTLPANAMHETSVGGEGKAYAKPDVAVVTLGVHTQAAKSQDAVNQNNTAMNQVISAVKSLGVADQDIQTTSYNLQPMYDYGKGSAGSPIVTGYQLDQQVQVKIRDFSKINDILDKATAAGANTVGDLQFTVDNMESVMAQARQKAIAQAKEKAKSLFAAAGLGQGRLVGIAENSPSVPQPLYGMNSAAVESAPQIQAGQVEADSTVTLTYEIK